MQTVKATVELCYYLLENENEINYVLLGYLQQDWLEGRFGWYRQLSGGNYYQSVLRFLQAEKSIRLRNLVKSGYNMKEIANIFSKVGESDEVTKQESVTFIEMLCEFRFSRHHNDVAITYYVAGYVSRGLTKKVKCQDCRLLFSNGEALPVQVENVDASPEELKVGNSFVDSINRGGLIKPSDLLFITCLHATELYAYIKDDPFLQKELISSKNSRSLFVEVFVQKLEEFDCTKKILDIQCASKHSFRAHCLHLATVMFNLFGKNLAAEYNNIIHKERKRAGVVEEKRDLTNIKSKKLKSSK